MLEPAAAVRGDAPGHASCVLLPSELAHVALTGNVCTAASAAEFVSATKHARTCTPNTHAHAHAHAHAQSHARMRARTAGYVGKNGRHLITRPLTEQHSVSAAAAVRPATGDVAALASRDLPAHASCVPLASLLAHVALTG